MNYGRNLMHKDSDKYPYTVTVKARYSGVMAESWRDAEIFILEQFYSGNTYYTERVEVDNDNS
jgi:hypothetical protein